MTVFQRSKEDVVNRTAAAIDRAIEGSTAPIRIPDEDRLERIDTVYATARFVSANLYAVIGTAVALIVLVLTLLGRAIYRRFRLTHAS